MVNTGFTTSVLSSPNYSPAPKNYTPAPKKVSPSPPANFTPAPPPVSSVPANFSPAPSPPKSSAPPTRGSTPISGGGGGSNFTPAPNYSPAPKNFTAAPVSSVPVSSAPKSNPNFITPSSPSRSGTSYGSFASPLPSTSVRVETDDTPNFSAVGGSQIRVSGRESLIASSVGGGVLAVSREADLPRSRFDDPRTRGSGSPLQSGRVGKDVFSFESTEGIAAPRGGSTRSVLAAVESPKKAAEFERLFPVGAFGSDVQRERGLGNKVVEVGPQTLFIPIIRERREGERKFLGGLVTESRQQREVAFQVRKGVTAGTLLAEKASERLPFGNVVAFEAAGVRGAANVITDFGAFGTVAQRQPVRAASEAAIVVGPAVGVLAGGSAAAGTGVAGLVGRAPSLVVPAAQVAIPAYVAGASGVLGRGTQRAVGEFTGEAVALGALSAGSASLAGRLKAGSLARQSANIARRDVSFSVTGKPQTQRTVVEKTLGDATKTTVKDVTRGEFSGVADYQPIRVGVKSERVLTGSSRVGEGVFVGSEQTSVQVVRETARGSKVIGTYDSKTNVIQQPARGGVLTSTISQSNKGSRSAGLFFTEGSVESPRTVGLQSGLSPKGLLSPQSFQFSQSFRILRTEPVEISGINYRVGGVLLGPGGKVTSGEIISSPSLVSSVSNPRVGVRTFATGVSEDLASSRSGSRLFGDVAGSSDLAVRLKAPKLVQVQESSSNINTLVGSAVRQAREESRSATVASRLGAALGRVRYGAALRGGSGVASAFVIQAPKLVRPSAPVLSVPVVRQREVAKTFTASPLDVRVGSFTRPRVSTTQASDVGTITGITPIAPTVQTPKLRTALVQTPTPSQPITQTPFGGSALGPFVGIPPVTVPRLAFPGSGGTGGRTRFKTKSAYVPSLRAIALNITGRTRKKGFSGLEERPLPTTKKGKAKRPRSQGFSYGRFFGRKAVANAFTQSKSGVSLL